MYATGANVYRSTNEGLTWVQMGAAAGITTSGRTLVSVSAADPDRVYLVQSKGNELGYIYRSNDAGLSFSITVTGNPATCTNFFLTPLGSGGKDVILFNKDVTPQGSANQVIIKTYF
jgi:hypothetical protein